VRAIFCDYTRYRDTKVLYEGALMAFPQGCELLEELKRGFVDVTGGLHCHRVEQVVDGCRRMSMISDFLLRGSTRRSSRGLLSAGETIVTSMAMCL